MEVFHGGLGINFPDADATKQRALSSEKRFS